MKNIISKYLTGLLLFLGLSIYTIGQVPIILTENGSNTGNKTFQARHLITLDAGFSYSPNGGSMRAEIVSPIGNASISTTQADTENRTLNTNYTVATLPGSVNVSQTGNASYSIPIDLPDGVNGLQPNLALSYVSVGSDGIVGKSWNVSGISSISRGAPNQYFDGFVDAVEFDGDDRFFLNGQRLIKISTGNYGDNGTEYRLEQNQSIKITYSKYSGTDKFIVKTANGNTIEYGNTSDSKVKGNDDGDILSWNVNKIIDNYGNEITFEYLSSHGTSYPIKINYANAVVEFDYKHRPLEIVNYLNGNKYTSDLLLDNIVVKMNNNLLRKYQLKYFADENINTSAPFLKEVILYGQNSHRLNSTLFEYDLIDDLNFTQTDYDTTHLYLTRKNDLHEGDFNGDGILDFLCIPNPNRGGAGTIWTVVLSTGNGGIYRNTGVDYSELKDVYIVDLNSDGLDDVVYEVEEQSLANFYYMINNTTSFSSPVNFQSHDNHIDTTGMLGLRVRLDYFENRFNSFADFNGDGILDLFWSDIHGNWKIFSMTNHSSLSTIASGQNTDLDDYVMSGDIDGDSKTEVWNFTEDGFQILELSNNNLVEKYSSGAINKNHAFRLADYNADGKTDIFVFGYNNDDTKEDWDTWMINLSKGEGFDCSYFSQLKEDLIDDYCRVGDFNGDGMADLMVSPTNNDWDGSYYYISIENGTKFKNAQYLEYPTYTHNYHLGDIDGDGSTDILVTDGLSPWWNGFQIYRSQGNKKDLLVGVSNGIGNYTEITYSSISIAYCYGTPYTKGTGASFPLQDFEGAYYVVDEIALDNGIGGTTTIGYTYEGAKIHVRGKGFLGFSKVKSENFATGIIQENQYSIDDTYFYPQLTSSITKRSTLTSNIQTTTNTWSEKTFSGSKRFIPYVSSSTVTNNLTNFVTSSSTSIDFYGNVTQATTSENNGPTTTQSISYSHDVPNWLIARPCTTITTHSDGVNPSISKTVSRSYLSGKVKPDIDRYYEGGTMKWQINRDYDTEGNLSVLHEYSSGVGASQTYYEYYSNGVDLKKITAPDGKITEYTYDSNGRLDTETDHWNNQTEYSYDNFGNVEEINIDNGIGSTISKHWITNNNPTNARMYTKTIGDDGSESRVYYDILGREIRSGYKSFNGDMIYTDVKYNYKGQQYQISEPFISTASQWTTKYYDYYGRITSIDPAIGATTSFSYSGGTTNRTVNGRTYSTTSNATGWVSQRTDPGGTITYSYFPDGNIKSITSPGNVTTSMTYDKQGNQLSLIDPSAGTINYTYTGTGAIKTQTTPIGSTTMHYESNGRLDYKTTDEGTYNYTYGPNKLLSSETSPNGVSRSYVYYSDGRLHEISETIESGQTNKISYLYDLFGRVEKKTYTNADNVSYDEEYEYNNHGYLEQIKFCNRTVYTINEVNVRDQLTSANVNGSTALWTYEDNGLIQTTPADYSYTYNPSTQNLIKRTNSFSTFDFTNGSFSNIVLEEFFNFDNLERLEMVSIDDSPVLELEYDNKGNIIYKSDAGTMSYNASSPYQLTSISPFTSNIPFSHQNATYTSFGKIDTLNEGNYNALFKYNSDHQRIKMETKLNGSTVKTKYYFNNSYEKIIENGNTTEYIWIGGSAYNAPVLAEIEDGWVTYHGIFRDHLGSICKTTGATMSYHLIDGIARSNGDSGTARKSYDAWGRIRSSTDWNDYSVAQSGLIADRGFTGHEHLTEFGLINMNGRLYDPLVGRFLSPDNYVQSPDFTQSFNRYGYCLNNPLKYTDPDGEWFFSLLFPPAAPVLVYLDVFLWSATIDWATQTITNYANNKDGNFSEWAYEDIDWLDVGVSGFAGTATMGLDKLYKAGKIGKSIYNVGRASNLLVMPAISARYDLVAGDEVEGVNVNKGNDFWTPYIYNVVTTGIAARTSNNIVDGLLSDTPWILADPLKGGLYKNLLEIPIGVATGVATNNALQPNETTRPSMPPFPTKPPYEITPNKSNYESGNLNNLNDLYINLQIDRF